MMKDEKGNPKQPMSAEEWARNKKRDFLEWGCCATHYPDGPTVDYAAIESYTSYRLSEERKRVEELLKEHWLQPIECLHIARSDVASCSCGWSGGIMPTVGYAVASWVKHVMELLASGPESGKERG